MALAAKLIGGIATASYLAFRALKRLREQEAVIQADTIRTARWVAGIMMAACRFAYDVVGVYLGNRPATSTAPSGNPNGSVRFGTTAAQHESQEAA
jgi:hypothetical protein